MALFVWWCLFLSFLVCRKKNVELQRNLDQIAEKARMEYGNKAKQRAIEEKQHKDKILEIEKKKKAEEQKGFFGRLFGF